MTRIALVVSDVDGTLVTREKVLTDAAKNAVRRLADAGIGFTIVSSRPTLGMQFLLEPLALALPFGAFNGSSIVDPASKPIEMNLIPAATAQRSIDVLGQFGVETWLFTNDRWLIRDPEGAYVSHEQQAIRHDPVLVDDFSPYLSGACKIVGASSDAALLQRCEVATKAALGTQATAVRSQSYYLDVTPPGHDKGTFVQAMARRLGIATDAVATIGDMENDLPMFRTSGLSFAMGNAADGIKSMATHVTASNEDDGFAKAVEMILKDNGVN
jgi:Cof subfamily protein (haloacid dehalogenase superfamily)